MKQIIWPFLLGVILTSASLAFNNFIREAPQQKEPIDLGSCVMLPDGNGGLTCIWYDTPEQRDELTRRATELNV